MHGRRGEDGQPLPSGGRVFRFAHKPKDFAGDRQPLPVGFNGFELSTDEKVGRPLRLSVFSTDLTTTAQGWRIAGAKHNLVLLLSIDGIRSLKLALDNPGIDVVWHHMDIPLPGACRNHRLGCRQGSATLPPNEARRYLQCFGIPGRSGQ